jgi:phosphoribosylglycinamide formyltransferase-1
MRILGPDFIARWPQRVINIHPALLPSFPGLDAQGQALRYGAKITGCTVHFVDEGMDTGPIILQKAVPVEASDDEETLSARILREEHKALPEALALWAAVSCRYRAERSNRKKQSRCWLWVLNTGLFSVSDKTGIWNCGISAGKRR